MHCSMGACIRLHVCVLLKRCTLTTLRLPVCMPVCTVSACVCVSVCIPVSMCVCVCVVECVHLWMWDDAPAHHHTAYA